MRDPNLARNTEQTVFDCANLVPNTIGTQLVSKRAASPFRVPLDALHDYRHFFFKSASSFVKSG
jgi:hypothetical protein